LARLACQGQKAAWDALYERHQRFLWWLATEKLHLKSERRTTVQRDRKGGTVNIATSDIDSHGRAIVSAEQLLNEVYVTVWDGRKLCKFTGRAAFNTWFAIVVRNILEDLRRKESVKAGFGPRQEIDLSRDAVMAAPELELGQENASIDSPSSSDMSMSAIDQQRRLDALPSVQSALFRIVHGLPPSWTDVDYVASLTGRTHEEVRQAIRQAFTRHSSRGRNIEKIQDKIAQAYSRMTELAREEKKLEDQKTALVNSTPTEAQRAELSSLTEATERIRARIHQLRRFQQTWREDAGTSVRLPSKEVAAIFGISVSAVNKRVERVSAIVRQLYLESKAADHA
jgi:DNA-directed RNA polymerase specialized sigma24 family protein